MRPALAVLLAILLIGCDHPKVLPEHVRTQVDLRLHFMPSAKLEATAQSKGLNGKERGFAVWSPNDSQCDVYLQLPESVDDEKTLTLGHEVFHCIAGQFH